MWKKWKETEFFRKLKRVRVNRAIYLSAIVILLTLSVVLAITAATNRAKKNDLTPPENDTLDNNHETETPPPQNNDAKPTVKDETPPELGLPVSGTLTRRHSVDTQVFSPTLQEYRIHLGIDIATEESAPVLAAAAGTVVSAGWDGNYGYSVLIDHGNGLKTRYAHASALYVKKGAVVGQGDVVAAVGSTGYSTGNHLHFEVIINGTRVNPAPYIGL